MASMIEAYEEAWRAWAPPRDVRRRCGAVCSLLLLV
jgi:hypothetical protein